MYDKSIVYEFGMYVPVVRSGDVQMRLEPCPTLFEAQALLDTLPPDCGEALSNVPALSGPKPSMHPRRNVRLLRTLPASRSSWFADKLDREDEFEDFVTKAEVCR